MKFSILAAEQEKKKSELLVSPRHDKWLAENSNLRYHALAQEFMAKQMEMKHRIRKATFSASSLAGCMRAQQFTFLGLPSTRPDERAASIFHNGTYMHLRWQMAGISEGWLAEAEVPIPENEYGLAGTMDGVLWEGSILELKSINDNGFKNVLQFGPQHKHKVQVAAYMLATERTKACFIYENKNTQEYREFVLTREDLKDELDVAEHTAEGLWEYTNKRELHEPLSKCIDRQGMDYKYCSYAEQCLSIRSWDDAVRQAR